MENPAKAEILRKIKESYIYIAIQIMTILLIFLFIELTVRLFTKHITPVDINAQTMITDKNQEPYFQMHPFASFCWIPNARFLNQSVNSQGFVSTKEFLFEKDNNEIRIITLGGSSTVGNGNPDKDTYLQILEECLQRQFPDKKITVINGAAGGYSTIESIGYLQTRLVYYRPDIIIIMHGWNDMYYFTLTDHEISEWRNNFNLQAMWNPNVSSKMKNPMPKDIQYLSWSQFYLHLREWIRHSSLFKKEEQKTIETRFENVIKNNDGSYTVKTKPINPKALETYEINLLQIRNICSNLKIRCYSVLQPTLISAHAERENPKIKNAVTISALYHSFDFDEHIKVFDRIYEINRNIFKNNIIDATVMNGKENLFFDHIHQNSYGTHELAEIICNKLKNEAF